MKEKLQEYALLAEIFSSIAILVTLIYLAVQTNQNTEALQAAQRQAIMAGDLEYIYRTNVDEPELALLRIKPNLTPEERIRLNGTLGIVMRMREFGWIQLQNGALDQQTWNAYEGNMLYTISFPNTRIWWNNSSPTFDEDFVSYVNSLLENVEIQDSLDILEAFDN